MEIDRQRRDHYEERMLAAQKKGAEACREYGECLSAIRNERLWADEYESFDLYCRHVWDLTEETANRWITTFQVSEGLTELGLSLEHLTIANAHALARIDGKDVRAEVWSEAQQASLSPTAVLIEEIAEGHKPLFKGIAHMTKEEELAFLQRAESDIEAATRFARRLEWKRVIVRANEKHLRTFESLNLGDDDPETARAVDQIREGVAKLKGE